MPLAGLPCKVDEFRRRAGCKSLLTRGADSGLALYGALKMFVDSTNGVQMSARGFYRIQYLGQMEREEEKKLNASQQTRSYLILRS